MNIGEALKQYRTSAGLTQKEFTQNILSPAHYSKIERNLHEISANDLLKLLSQIKYVIQIFSHPSIKTT